MRSLTTRRAAAILAGTATLRLGDRPLAAQRAAAPPLTVTGRWRWPARTIQPSPPRRRATWRWWAPPGGMRRSRTRCSGGVRRTLAARLQPTCFAHASRSSIARCSFLHTPRRCRSLTPPPVGDPGATHEMAPFPAMPCSYPASASGRQPGQVTDGLRWAPLPVRYRTCAARAHTLSRRLHRKPSVVRQRTEMEFP